MKKIIHFVNGLILLLLLGCGPNASSATVSQLPDPAVPQLPTEAILLPTITPTKPQLALTPIPTVTASPAAPATLPPTNTPIPAVTPTMVLPTPIPVDRRCPDPPPAVPRYTRFTTGEAPLAQPIASGENRFWLEKPLPGGGRFLVNTTYPYGFDANGSYLLHNGVDSAAPLGTPLLAIGDGTVLVAQSDEDELYGWRCNWYGQVVIVELDRKWQGRPIYALYGHVLNIMVEPGQQVKAGEQLAEVGFGGAAVVPHLHFELRVGSNSFDATRNPMLWIRPPETRGVVAGRLVDPNGRPWHGIWLNAISREDGETSYVSWTYLDDPRHLIQSDETYGENFVISDMLPGEYRVYVQIQDVNYSGDVTVQGGEISTVEIVTDYYKPELEGEEDGQSASELEEEKEEDE